MSLKPQAVCPVPQETARVARAAYPKGNLYMQMRDVFGNIYWAWNSPMRDLTPRCCPNFAPVWEQGMLKSACWRKCSRCFNRKAGSKLVDDSAPIRPMCWRKSAPSTACCASGKRCALHSIVSQWLLPTGCGPTVTPNGWSAMARAAKIHARLWEKQRVKPLPKRSDGKEENCLMPCLSQQHLSGFARFRQWSCYDKCGYKIISALTMRFVGGPLRIFLRPLATSALPMIKRLITARSEAPPGSATKSI